MASRPALIVVDMQNDFCPPDGSLAVQGGRDLIPSINKLLCSPKFTFKVGTKDWHPETHISFASNHPPPNNQPFASHIEIHNHVANKPHETMLQRLWPVHCVQNTSGAEFVQGLDADKFDLVVLKGMDAWVEMYSAFTDSFGNLVEGIGGVSCDLGKRLREEMVDCVYVVGLAGDYCVKDTAIGAVKAGFETYLVEECQSCVNAEIWEKAKEELGGQGVRVVGIRSEEVKRVLE